MGHFPQSIHSKHNCDVWNEPKFIEHHELKPIGFDPIVSNAIIHNNAKLTDVISTSGMGFTRKLIISKKLKSILEGSRHANLEFFELSIIKNDDYINNYFILYFHQSSPQFIDFKNSEIFLMNGLFDELNKLDITNFEEFLIESQNI